jgi:hypothetical protein
MNAMQVGEVSWIFELNQEDVASIIDDKVVKQEMLIMLPAETTGLIDGLKSDKSCTMIEVQLYQACLWSIT